MKIVFYLLYLSRLDAIEPIAKYDSLQECRQQATALTQNVQKYNKDVRYFCDHVKDNYVTTPFDYMHVLDVPYCDEKGQCQFLVQEEKNAKKNKHKK